MLLNWSTPFSQSWVKVKLLAIMQTEPVTLSKEQQDETKKT